MSSLIGNINGNDTPYVLEDVHKIRILNSFSEDRNETTEIINSHNGNKNTFFNFKSEICLESIENGINNNISSLESKTCKLEDAEPQNNFTLLEGKTYSTEEDFISKIEIKMEVEDYVMDQEEATNESEILKNINIKNCWVVLEKLDMIDFEINAPMLRCKNSKKRSKSKLAYVKYKNKLTSNKNFKCFRKSVVKKFFCDTCSYETSSKGSLRDHKETCCTVFTCQECEFSTKFKCLLEKHKDEKHEKELLKCAWCYYTSYRAKALKGHIENHDKKYRSADRKNKDEEYVPVSFRCRRCNFIGISTADRADHYMKQHKRQTQEQEIVCNDMKRTKHIQKCLKCGFVSKTLEELKHHMKNHMPYKCGDCDFGYSRREELTKHMKSIHEKDNFFECEFCDFKTYKKNKLTLHSSHHTGVKPFQCKFCSYTAALEYYLKMHENKHAGKNVFKCTFCSYECARKDYLRKHLRTHTGEKPYSCTECNYTASNKTSLNIHMRSHKGPRPYSCDLCNFTTAVLNSLEKHFKQHEGNKYICQFCKYSYKLRESFAGHLRIHAEFLPFKCCKCDFSSNVILSFATHVGECGNTEKKNKYLSKKSRVETG